MLLKGGHGGVELFPVTALSQRAHARKIGAHSEGARVVVPDHEAGESATFHARERLAQRAKHAGAQRIHLAVELETCHTVSQIQQTRVI